METLNLIYWSKACLGIVTALLCMIFRINDFLTGLSLGIIVFLLSDIILRRLFIVKVEDPRKILTTGIGAFFLVWIVSWVLFYSLMFPTGLMI
jgi:hypothetical protein